MATTATAEVGGRGAARGRRFWADELVADLEGPQVVNDSKTPSGRVHVGALRGVLIHDAVYRVLTQKGIDATYLFGSDDYDPVDELPAGQGEQFRTYLGMPLCNVPAPTGSPAGDLAEHYIGELFGIFTELGVGATTYRMRDLYRSGRFNASIDTILRHADVARRIDRKVAGARRADDWHPFQVICERCGRIGTTRVTHYDGSQVSYTCEPELVSWATGCGHRGTVSPFDGNGKLSWKLEWVAKWHEFGVTIEGAGKDHNAKGGSREVAVRCLEEIFGDPAPRNIPYEFFLVGGAKMSSSRGVGVAARDIADLLPPEVLRFLVLRSNPKSTVDFEPDEARITALFGDFDRHRERVATGQASEGERRVYELSQVGLEEPSWMPPFPLVLSVVQMPHLDTFGELARLKGSPLTEVELEHLRRRVATAEYWVSRYATDDERLQLREALPDSVRGLFPTQTWFLHELAERLRPTEPPEAVEWEPEALQRTIFDVARRVPIGQPEAFRALYRAFFDRDSGPKAGNLLAFLDRSFVVERLDQVPVSEADVLVVTAVSREAIEAWLTDHRDELVEVTAEPRCAGEADGAESPQVCVVELTARLQGGKTHVRRYLCPAERVEHEALSLLASLADRLSLPLSSP